MSGVETTVTAFNNNNARFTRNGFVLLFTVKRRTQAPVEHPAEGDRTAQVAYKQVYRRSEETFKRKIQH